jgi:flagellar biosynthesis GTPase FlhF
MMMNKRKGDFRFFCFVFFAGIILGNGGLLHAQVDRTELEKNLGPVTFINYEGPHSKIETAQQIRDIGYALGLAVKAGTQRPGPLNRYFVIHSVTDAEDGKLDADIFGLGVDTGVDHIRNLRRIIQGYLEGAYDYSARDATVLAEYITIYNAVYRGDWNYFGDRYKADVMQNLTAEKTGLSIRFDEWPGRTLMVIPMGMGGLSSVDTSAISDSRVVDELRKDDDRGVDQRKDMVDLKEREAEEAEQRAQAQREAIREEEKRIADERARIKAEQDRIAEERRQNQNDAAAGRTTPQENQQREQNLNQREQAANQQARETDRREENVSQQRQEAQKNDDFAEQKNAEAQQERERIAQDQQALINNENYGVTGVLGATIESSAASLGRLLRLNPANGAELKRSPLDTVNVRTVTFLGEKIIAIAGEDRGNGAIRLIEVNPTSLEMAKQGDNDIHPQSLLWVNGSDLYAVTVVDGSLYLGRFNADLALQAQSKITVHPYASVIFQDDKVLTQRADGKAAILNSGNLTEIQ